MSQQQKTYSLTLSEFRDYLSTKTSEMRACYQETEEIQFQFNDIFKSELAAWQEQFKFCFQLFPEHNIHINILSNNSTMSSVYIYIAFCL